MSINEILTQRRATLAEVIKSSTGSNGHLDAFAKRLLIGLDIAEGFQPREPLLLPLSDRIAYSGFPELACLGFELGSNGNSSDETISRFLDGIQRLVDRSSNSLQLLRTDDIALLGLADGLAYARGIGRNVEALIQWLLELIDQSSGVRSWSHRARLLGGELLKKAGRMKLPLNTTNTDELALDLALRFGWSGKFESQYAPDNAKLGALLKELITAKPPVDGDLDRAAVWYRAIDSLIDQACLTLTPSISDTVRLLINMQGALKRWVWKPTGRRKNTSPSQWLIDDESDVQALLWAILYPIYGSDLVDETYLPNWGFVQPRADLGIQKLKLIIEVKIAREPGDFAKFEGQIGEDIGLYFKDTSLYDRMIVLLYDDCDRHQPENHAGFRNALLKRGADRIEDVVIIRRPSMIPNRNNRQLADHARDTN